jgi:GR25 family glycosyltransferase involved in LPS biosynthesis
MEVQFKHFGINPWPTRVSGVDGKNPSAEEQSYIRYLTHRGSPLEMACTLSHLSALKYAHNMQWEHVLILEDDVDFCLVPFWRNSLKALCDELPPDWYVANLNAFCLSINCNSEKIYKATETDCVSAAAYLVHRRALNHVSRYFYDGTEKLVAEALLRTRTMIADFMIKLFGPSYLVCPRRFIQNNSDLGSTIHNDDTPEHMKVAISTLQYYLTT